MNKTFYVLIVCAILFSNYTLANTFKKHSINPKDSVFFYKKKTATLNLIVNCPGNLNVASFSDYYLLPDFFASGEATISGNTTAISETSQHPLPGSVLPNGTHTITLSATDESGNVGSCEFELNLSGTSNSSLSTNDSELDFLNLYPNPVKDVFYIENPQKINLINLKIFNLSGKQILYFDLRNKSISEQINLSALQTGNYLVSIESEKGSLSKVLLKQ